MEEKNKERKIKEVEEEIDKIRRQKRFMENILRERNVHLYEKEAAKKGLKETEEKLQKLLEERDDLFSSN